jgi:hypothetical protein
MKKFYPIAALSLAAILSFTGSACAQSTKMKTITIINGDTTISEKNIDDKELAEIDKKITVIINEDGKGESSHKKIVKKTIINTDKKRDSDATAYAYSIGDDKDQDIQVISDGDEAETKISIEKSDDKKGDLKDKKMIVKKSISMNDDTKGSMNININVKNSTAKLEIETNSKEPLNVTVLDENGKQVFYDSQKNGGNYSKEIKLDKKGTYFLNLIQNKKSTTEKIVVE